VLPQANSRAWAPPTAAYCHSASVGNLPSSQTQKANASYQLTQLMGFCSLYSGSSVQVCCVALQFSPTRSTAALPASSTSQLGSRSQPLPRL
jgi:hypothetical protein